MTDRLILRFARRVWPAALVLVMAGLFLLPFVVMVTTAFKPPTEVFSLPTRLLPQQWTLDNVGQAFEAMPFVRYGANTVFVSGMTVLGTLIACPLVGYSLAKLRWRGRGPLLVLVLATMMIPPQVTIIPLFLLWDRLGLIGTYVPLILPAFFGTPFFIFLMRQFFLGIPNDLLEAARIDGASETRIYLQLVLPLAKPALATIAVFQFIFTWTDFFNPLIYLNNADSYTLSVGLYAFFNERGVDWGPLMAASVLFTLPALFVFILAQRFFVEGIATTGFK